MIHVVDALPGTGKTSAAIRYINESEPDKHFLYITPFIREGDRVAEACPTKSMCRPNTCTTTTKLRDLKNLVRDQRNIASTHSLFQFFDDETIELLYRGNYTLILDEAFCVIEKYDMSAHDLSNILENHAHADEKTGLLTWDDVNYRGDYYHHKRCCDNGSLAVYSNTAVLWMFPVRMFKAFSEIYVLTYMFEAQLQKAYYDAHGVEYDYLGVRQDANGQYKFCEPKDSIIKTDWPNLIHILDNAKMNRIGDLENTLSKGWYNRNKDNLLMQDLRNNTYNFFRHHSDAEANQRMWTTFKAFRHQVKGKGYANAFVPSNARATNDYKDCTAVAYLINRFQNPIYKNYLSQRGASLDDDAYALSELVQFVFRAAIRKGEPIDLYLPSLRMRELLQGWIQKVGE